MDVVFFVVKFMGKFIIIVYYIGELKKGFWIDVLVGFYERMVEKMILWNIKIILVF